MSTPPAVSSTSASMPLLQVRGVTFRYGEQSVVLRDISFDLFAGQCLLVVGPNGAGKSTLLHILANLVPEYVAGGYEGDVFVDGKRHTDRSSDDRGRIALVQQNPDAQIVSMRVDEEVAFGLCNLGIPRADVFTETEATLSVFGLAPRRAESPDLLSFGLKQRLVTAAVSVLKPQILLLDEPISNADREGRMSILAMLRAQKNAGRSLVIVTHDLGPFLSLADSILLLSGDGRVVRQGDTLSIAADTALLRKLGIEPPIGVATRETEIREAIEATRRDSQEHAHRDELPIVLALENVSFAYPKGRLVLDDVSLEIRKGECFGIIGRNGTGKSTLLRLCAGLLQPVAGRILMNGDSLDDLAASQVARRVACVLQDPDTQLVYAESVHAEVFAGPLAAGAVAEVESLLATLGIAHLRARFPGALSFGEKKKLLIASALARRPDVLLLDEPFFSLDARGHDDLTVLLRALNARGITIVVVSHDLESMLRTTDRVAVLDANRIALCGETAAVLSDRRLRRLGLREATLFRLERMFGKAKPHP